MPPFNFNYEVVPTWAKTLAAEDDPLFEGCVPFQDYDRSLPILYGPSELEPRFVICVILTAFSSEHLQGSVQGSISWDKTNSCN